MVSRIRVKHVFVQVIGRIYGYRLKGVSIFIDRFTLPRKWEDFHVQRDKWILTLPSSRHRFYCIPSDLIPYLVVRILIMTLIFSLFYQENGKICMFTGISGYQNSLHLGTCF